MTRTVWPEFDGKWFVFYRGELVEATSLRELKRKLGHRAIIRGYHPNGYYPHGFKKIERPKPISTVAVPKEKQTGKVIKTTTKTGKHVNSYDHEAVLNLWAVKKSSAEIAEILGGKIDTIAKIIGDARAKNDPRAVKRLERDWTNRELEELFQMKNQGMTFGQIGKALGRSRSAIGGKMYRAESQKLVARNNADRYDEGHASVVPVGSTSGGE